MDNSNAKVIRLQRRLAAARGEISADLVITNAHIVDVYSGSIGHGSLAVFDGVIVGIGDYCGKETVNLDRAYLLPGLIESHIHIESAKVMPSAFAQAVAPLGTTTIIADPHEIANVQGIEGIRLMIEDSRTAPVDILYMLPSCVPATDMETAGAVLSAEDIAPLLGEPNIIGIGEMMNFPGALTGDSSVLDKLALAELGMPIDGHSPGLGGHPLNAYILSGPGSDHECTTLSEAREKLAKGMRIFIREGSTARNLEHLAPLVTPATERRICLATDDKRPDEIISNGHLDHLLRRAVECGIPPITAVRMATLNAAEAFGLCDRGGLKPGMRADLVAVEDLTTFRAIRVWNKGCEMAKDGAATLSQGLNKSVERQASCRLNLPDIRADHFRLASTNTKVKVIVVIPNQIVTGAEIHNMQSVDGNLISDVNRDILKLAVIERYTGNAGTGLGFVKGMGLKRGALASTVAHDSHNVIVVGIDEESMATAVNHLAKVGGGQCAAVGDEIVSDLPLPVGGLMSGNSVGMTAQQERNLHQATRELGSHLDDPFMALSFLALPVIPALKLTDKGLVDVNEFKLVPLAV